MRIAYYQKPDGTIRYFHSVDKISPEELGVSVAKYNLQMEKDTGEKVHIVEYEPGSFEAHLFRMATNHIKFDLENLRDLRNFLNEADDILCDLIREAESVAKLEAET